jgi:hypothetical protein
MTGTPISGSYVARAGVDGVGVAVINTSGLTTAAAVLAELEDQLSTQGLDAWIDGTGALRIDEFDDNLVVGTTNPGLAFEANVGDE